MQTPDDPSSPDRSPPAGSGVSAVAGIAAPRDPRAYAGSARRVETGAGMEWIVDAWRIFVRAPFMWIAMAIAYAVFFTVISVVPLVGWLLGGLLWTVVGAGWLEGAAAVDRGEALEPSHLFAGFRRQLVPLLWLGALYVAGEVAILLVMGAVATVGMGASGAMAAILNGNLAEITSIELASFKALLLVLLVGMGLMVPLMMAIWFAPALVYFHGESPWAAMRSSFLACAVNVLPFTIYGLVMLVLAILAAIPLMLGYLLLGPLVLLTAYTSYRDIYFPAGPVRAP